MTDQQKAGEMFAYFVAFVIMYILVPMGIVPIVRVVRNHFQQKKKVTTLTLTELQNHVSNGAVGHLTRVQTTFVEIIVEKIAYRIDFRGKREFAVKAGAFSSLEILAHHPLLLDYTEPKATLYFSAAPVDAEAFLTDLQAANGAVFGNWRDLKRYLNPQMSPQTLLRTNGGMLLHGPLPLVLRAHAIAEAHRMQTSITRGKAITSPPQILLLDRHYIIAEQFFSERLMHGETS